jgi:hypothetical protein
MAEQNQGSELDTLRSIIMGEESKAIRALIKNVESSFAQQLRGIRQEVTKAVEDLRKEISAEVKTISQRVGDEEKARISIASEVQTKMKDTMVNLDIRLQKAEGQMKDSLAKVSDNLERSMAGRFVDAEARMHEIEEKITQQAREISTRKAESAKLAGLFGNFARTFSGIGEEESAPAPAPAPRARPAAAPAAAPRSAAAPQQAGPQGDLPQSDDLLGSMDALFNLGGQKPKK